MKRMKINFVLPSMGNSGGIDVVYKYADLLTKDGHDVTVYKELAASNMHRYKNPIKNKVHQIYCTIKGIIAKKQAANPLDKFVFYLNNRSVQDADVIIATAWPTAYKINMLADSKGKKFYFIQDYEIWDNDNIAKETYKLPLNKIVISTWINKRIKQDLDIGPFPILYNGIDTSVYHNNHSQKNNAEVNFLMLNHTLPKKGVGNGLEAYEKISEKYSNCKLRMFGMCDRSNLPSYVEYYQNPSKEKIVELYSTSDIFIFPSVEEGWGLAPLEAMACGCAVVGTQTGFVLDLGCHEENIMISAPGNVNEMVDNIIKLIEKRELCDQLKKEAINTAKSLVWNNSAIKLVALLKESMI